MASLPKMGQPHYPTLFSVVVVVVILLALHHLMLKKKG